MKRIENLNRATGFILVVVGIVNFVEGIYLVGFSWLIFGSMYLVMDSYRLNKEKQPQEEMAVLVRKIFGWVGFLASFALLVYTMVQI